MSDATLPGPLPGRRTWSLAGWKNRLVASRRFQSWASKFPLTRRIARAEGEALFDLVAGFIHSQVLHALLDMKILEMLMERPQTASSIAHGVQAPAERIQVLMRAATSLGLVKERRDGRFALAQKGAALLGVPGLREMILHHSVLYRDLAEPAAFFRGETETELARFWPYVFGEGAETDPRAAGVYSDLMADSQGLVAEETLRAINFSGTRRLLDVGGGTGAFLAAALRANPEMEGALLDLPDVIGPAKARFASAGVAERVEIVPGNFRRDELPSGQDAISLVRVLYDHEDHTVGSLLRKVHNALPEGGRLIVSEPMAGDQRAERAGDAYFAIYTLAMGTGKTRKPSEVADLMRDAGFRKVSHHRTYRPFVTSVLSGVKAT